MTIRTPSGNVFESGCDQLEVTSMSRPDPAWDVKDANGHEHRWYVDGQPAQSYSPRAKYDVPSLVTVHDGWEYDEDGERYEIAHRECRLCGEHIEPGYTADTDQQFIPGLRWCRINGEPVTLDEFTRRYHEAKG